MAYNMYGVSSNSVNYVYEEAYGGCNLNTNSMAVAINWACRKHKINPLYGLLFACGVHKVLQGTSPEQFLNGVDHQFKDSIRLMYGNLEGKSELNKLF